ncbi:MAG: hypothetical protein COB20_05925 [SAR86 cluster bacterium]|uniref:Uncharacterized protein n=1 Tax=SAR86 cluster bacterium TaxID=2030880 RepID=A0A2A4XA91_9GAMM|nr:MAG: hypothetical protein COB20_05925 [SAR86 cluster bacterium]
MKHHIEGRVSILAKLTLASALLLILVLASSLLKAQAIPVGDLPIILKTGTTAPRQANLTVTQASDPAGHSCCVTAPPSLIEIFLIEGDLIFRENQNGNVIPWLDFEPMPIDSNLEFIGQSRATVAGFSNILTVLSGNVTQDGIAGRFTIGADGGLPGAQPIIYDFLLEAAIGLGVAIPTTSYLSIHTEVGFVFSIINVPLEEEKPEDLYLLMDAGGGGTDAEWWLLMLIGGDLFSFDINSGTFKPGLQPTYQGPTVDIPEPVKFWTFSEPPTGEVSFFFGIDTSLDFLLNEEELIGTGFTFFF